MRRQNDKSQVVASFFTKIPKPTSVSSQVQDLHVQVTQDSACPCHMERASDLQDILSRQIFHPGVTLTVPPLFLVSETLRSNKNNEFKGICYKWLTFQKFYLNFGVVFFLFHKISHFFPAVLEGNLFTSYWFLWQHSSWTLECGMEVGSPRSWGMGAPTSYGVFGAPINGRKWMGNWRYNPCWCGKLDEFCDRF